MNRIEALYSFIDEEDKVVDVGCDQAKLGLMLAGRKQYSIASDKSINVIDRAIHDIGNNKYIDLRVSNGLENLKENEADTIVLAGMGTHTILNILKKTDLRFKKVITISNNYHDILRKSLLELNYIVDSELIIYENNKYYNLIMFKEGTTKYSEEEILFGINHKNKELYSKYLDFLLEKYSTINKQANFKNKKIITLINLINKIKNNL